MLKSSKKLSHTNERGDVRMVDVSHKPSTERRARAEAFVAMDSATVARLREGSTAKGDVLATARIAGIMGAKKTSELIPMCHPIALTHAEVELSVLADGVHIHTSVATTGPTGVEMEALTAASTAALTLYDMLKAVERGIQIVHVRLVEKSGGKSGHWTRD